MISIKKGVSDEPSGNIYKSKKNTLNFYKWKITFANPKSASLTDPLASTSIFAHLMSLLSDQMKKVREIGNAGN